MIGSGGSPTGSDAIGARSRAGRSYAGIDLRLTYAGVDGSTAADLERRSAVHARDPGPAGFVANVGRRAAWRRARRPGHAAGGRRAGDRGSAGSGCSSAGRSTAGGAATARCNVSRQARRRRPPGSRHRAVGGGCSGVDVGRLTRREETGGAPRCRARDPDLSSPDLVGDHDRRRSRGPHNASTAASTAS